MASIKQTAMAYESRSTKNISELNKVSAEIEVEKRTAKNNKGEQYEFNVLIHQAEEYRVPNSVLKSLKAILEYNPDLKEFKVQKSGEGMDTEYTVIPLS